MKEKFTILALLSILVLTADAQTLLLMGRDSSYAESNMMIEVSAGLDYRSNGLTNAFTDKFIFGGQIEDDLKDHVQGEVDGKYRFGGDISGGVRFFDFSDSLFGSSRCGLFVEVSTNYHARAFFADDFYDVAMYGNRSYAGDTASFDELSAHYLSWQQAGVGLFDKKTLSFVSLSIVNGQALSAFFASNAGLYTSLEGDFMTLELVGERQESDTATVGFGSSNGVGSALNARWNLPLKKDKGFVSVNLKNVGFINWNEQTLNYEADTTLQYSGVSIEEVFSDENEVKFPIAQDSVYQEVEKRRKTTFLPATISVAMNHKLGESGFYTVGTALVASQYNYPLVHAGYSHYISERMLLGFNGAYGGFGNFRMGAQFQWWTKSNWYLQLQVADLAGMFIPDAKGRGANLTISKFFKSQDDRRSTEN